MLTSVYPMVVCNTAETIRSAGACKAFVHVLMPFRVCANLAEETVLRAETFRCRMDQTVASQLEGECNRGDGPTTAMITTL